MRLDRNLLSRLTLLPLVAALAIGLGCESDDSSSSATDAVDAGASTGGESSQVVTLAQYNAVKARMSYAAVIDIMGRPADDDLYLPGSVPDVASKNYRTWENPDNSSIIVMFDSVRDSVYQKQCNKIPDANGQWVTRDDRFYNP